MSYFLRIIVRIIIVVIVVFLAFRGFNWFCQLTEKCQSFDLQDLLLPKVEGEPVKVVPQVTNYDENIEFGVMEPVVDTVVYRKNVINFRLKNYNPTPVRVKFILHVEPSEFKKLIKFYDCPCFNEYKLKGGEEKTIKASFRVFSVRKEGPIVIRYELKKK